MNTENDPALGITRKKNANRLSKDRKWRSFPRVPHLLQYVSSGTYFARIKVRGKIIRASLETNVWSTAQLRLVDFLKDKQIAGVSEGQHRMLCSEAVEVYKKRVESDAAMKESSKGYRFLCIRKIIATWPEFGKRFLGEITEAQCREWAAGLQDNIASQYFNNVVGTLRLILDEGIKVQASRGGVKLDNPAENLSRARISQKVLKLPEPGQFKSLITAIHDSSSWGPRAADLVEFLAYGGMRLYTEAQWVKWDDVDWKRMEIIVRGNPESGTKNWEVRRIPILPDMELLLKRMLAEKPESHTGKLLEIVECPITLTKTCSKIGIPRITHHDFRHLFATRCIEAGVDIPTVARWLGHKDGGALAMRTYGHLRNEHSQAMAQKVKF